MAPAVLLFLFSLPLRPPPGSTLFPYTTLFRSQRRHRPDQDFGRLGVVAAARDQEARGRVDQEHGGRETPRSEEHTSELQSRRDLVCRLLLEKKKNIKETMFRARITVMPVSSEL